MPQLQYLGAVPSKLSGVAEAIRGGVETYGRFKGMRQEGELKLAEISFEKKQKAAELIMKQTENATPQQRQQIGESQAGKLVVDVYGQEVFDTWMGVSGRRKAGKLAKVDTWIATKKKQSPMTGIPIPLGKQQADISIALELNDANWRTTYPDRAKAFDLAYPTISKKEKKTWPWGKKTDYKGMSEQDLFSKAKAGDQEAINEALRRGYAVGGR